MRVLNRALAQPMECEEHSAVPLAGGIVGHGYQCGMLWGAALAGGAHAYRRLGAGAQAETAAVMAAQRLVESFRPLNNAINCSDITGMDKSASTAQMLWRALGKGGAIRCFGMSARYARLAFGELDGALSENHVEAPPAPVSCAALLAQKMGASDVHRVMAAALAGGIGLSGGACGALGAAIWINGMNGLEKAGGKIQYKSAGALAMIDRFTRCSNGEFECAKIVGRKFAGIRDHASYLGAGGCAQIIEVLAATSAR